MDIIDCTHKQQYKFKFSECIGIPLCKDSLTVDILDRYFESQKDFLVLERVFETKNLDNISLVISKNSYNKNLVGMQIICSDFTMTELKKYVSSTIDIDKFKLYEEIIRKKPVYQLCKSILEVFPNNSIYNKYIPLKSIRYFRAQSSRNRSGYGDVWLNGMQIHKGTEYGETDNFAIIGIVLRSRHEWLTNHSYKPIII